MTTLTIRPATHEDLPTLLRFEQGIIEAERHFDASNSDGIIHYYKLAEMLTSEDVHVVVAEEQGNIIGCGYARIEDAEPYKKLSLHSYIGFLYLEPEHRGKGVIQSILQHLKEWSVARGVLELILEVYLENDAAVRAYQKFGFEKKMILMRLSLDE